MKLRQFSLLSAGIVWLGGTALEGGISSPSNVAGVTTPSDGSGAGAVTEWYGPFSSWDDVKSKYGAKGDGVADDTAAIQAALNNVGVNGNSPVLYFPAGTYRVTNKLLLLSNSDVELWGADPATTTILWDGAGGGTLFQLDGAEGDHLARLTFDGNNKANIAFDHSQQNGTHFDGDNVFEDCVFKNATYGVRGGAYGGGFASVVFNRCTFRQLTYGLSTWNWNALDGYLNRCLVEQCQYGLYVWQGSSHAYGTTFRSNQWDLFYVPAVAFFSAVNNTSYNSGGFLYMTNPGWNSSPVLLKGNTVIDPTNSVPIQMGQYGPLLLLDNVIAQRSGASGPAIQCSNYWAPDLVAVGNTFTVANWFSASGTSIRTNFVDNTVVTRASLNLGNPPNPVSALNLNRTVTEVSTNADNAAIQTALNNAGTGTIVHVPWGNHGCTGTIAVPPGKAVILLGDGHRSDLVWNGASGSGPLLQLSYPSQATVTHLGFHGNSNAKALIQIDGIGSQAARVLLKDSWVTFGVLDNVLIGDVPNASFEQQSVSCQYATASGANNVRLEGRGKGRWFCVDSGDDRNNFVCTNGGALYVETHWEEGSGTGRSGVKLSGNSTASFVSTKFAINADTLTKNMVQVTDFSGNFLFALSGNLTDWLKCSGSGNGDVWALGGSSLPSLAQPYLTNTSSSITLTESMNQWAGPSTSGNLKLADKGSAPAAFVRKMTAQARSEYPTFLPYNRLAGQTDVLLNRIFVEQGQVNLWLKP